MTAPTDEQRGLAEAVAALLAKRSDSGAVRRTIDSGDGYDSDLWRVLCEQIGVAALAVPERFGGVGAGAREVQLVLEELGRTLTPSPMLGSVLASCLVRAAGDDDAAARLLPAIADGAVVAVAWAGADGRWGDGAFAHTGGRLTGEAHYVLDSGAPAVVLAVADGALYEVDAAAAQRTVTPAMDPTRRLASIRLAGAPARRVSPEDARAALSVALDETLVALAGEQVGAASRVLEMTVAYAKVRYQFGRPIGSFQALKHRMADLHVLLEAARSAAYAAADGALPAAAAKAYCSEAFATIAGEAIQLHGGIAITWEHDAHLYFKRAHGSSTLFGGPDEHRRRVEGIME